MHSPSPMPTQRTNVADRLAFMAVKRPDDLALIVAKKGNQFEAITFTKLDQEATHIALGLRAMGIGPEHRIALLVRPGIEFVTLVFALLRSRATMVLVDAGLGRSNIVRCLASTEPDGFVGIPLAQMMRLVKRKQFPNAKLNVTVGRRWFWGGETLNNLRTAGRVIRDEGTRLPNTSADDPAAIVFTSGSTGPPKGVLYRHETFVTQATEIQSQYGLAPGNVDLACFPLFGLFNVACGVTTVFPEMDFSRPADCDPVKLITAANHWNCNQAFASPAVWDKLSRHCDKTNDQIPSLENIFSCGAPVTAPIIKRTLQMVAPQAKLHTPYGATESLPVATIEASEVLAETSLLTDLGAGVCVGRKFDSIEWRIIRITDEPIESIQEVEELPQGEIGELIVRGPQVSRQYLANTPELERHNKVSKITDGDNVWHRIGDVGYFDDEQRFWYCGRKSQRVVTGSETFFTECVEQLANTIDGIRRTALVGLDKPGQQQPVLIIEKESNTQRSDSELLDDLRDLLTHNDRSRGVEAFLFHPELPVDIRHNSKIFREQLTEWAAANLSSLK